jgi:hypothetical protein
MDTASDDFLAGSGFPQKERWPTAFPEFLHQSQYLPCTNRLTHQYVTALFKWRKHSRSGLLGLVNVECVSQS